MMHLVTCKIQGFIFLSKNYKKKQKSAEWEKNLESCILIQCLCLIWTPTAATDHFTMPSQAMDTYMIYHTFNTPSPFRKILMYPCKWIQKSLLSDDKWFQLQKQRPSPLYNRIIIMVSLPRTSVWTTMHTLKKNFLKTFSETSKRYMHIQWTEIRFFKMGKRRS